MRRESSTGISNQTTFWSEEMNKRRIRFTSSTLGWQSATSLQTASTFPLETVRTLQELQDMQVSTLILATNNREEMILKQSDMLSFTSWKARCHGKACQADPKLRSMQTSKRRRKRPRSRTCARTNLKNSKNSCTTAAALVSHKTRTTDTSSDYSKAAWRGMALTWKTPTSSGIRIDLFWRKKPSRDRCWTSLTKNQVRKTRPSDCRSFLIGCCHGYRLNVLKSTYVNVWKDVINSTR